MTMRQRNAEQGTQPWEVILIVNNLKKQNLCSVLPHDFALEWWP